MHSVYILATLRSQRSQFDHNSILVTIIFQMQRAQLKINCRIYSIKPWKEQNVLLARSGEALKNLMIRGWHFTISGTIHKSSQHETGSKTSNKAIDMNIKKNKLHYRIGNRFEYWILDFDHICILRVKNNSRFFYIYIYRKKSWFYSK